MSNIQLFVCLFSWPGDAASVSSGTESGLGNVQARLPDTRAGRPGQGETVAPRRLNWNQ